MIVLDASSTLEFVLGTPLGEQIWRAAGDADLHVPEVWHLEVLEGLRRMVRSRQLDHGRAEAAAVDALAINPWTHPHALVADRVWTLSASMSTTEASYLALAELLEAPLLTTDPRLRSASVEVLLLSGRPAASAPSRRRR